MPSPLAAALTVARDRFARRVERVGAPKARVVLVEELAHELGVALPSITDVPATWDDARESVRALLDVLALEHLSAEARARIAGHLDQLQRLAAHTMRVTANAVTGEAQP